MKSLEGNLQSGKDNTKWESNPNKDTIERLIHYLPI